MAKPTHKLCAQGRTWFLFQSHDGHAKLTPHIPLPSLQPCSWQSQLTAFEFTGCPRVDFGVVGISTLRSVPAFIVPPRLWPWAVRSRCYLLLQPQRDKCWRAENVHTKNQQSNHHWAHASNQQTCPQGSNCKREDEMPTWEVMTSAESAQHQLQSLYAASLWTWCLWWDTPDNLANQPAGKLWQDQERQISHADSPSPPSWRMLCALSF